MLEAIGVIAALGIVTTLSVIAAYAAITKIGERRNKKQLAETMNFLHQSVGILLDIVGSIASLNNRTTEHKNERRNYYE